MAELWPVPGLIHPGITCVMGQPERGKTTLLISLCDALLRDGQWLGQSTCFPDARRIMFFCEDRSSTARVRGAFRETGLASEVAVLQLHRWESGRNLAPLVEALSAGLVVIDSVYQAVGDVNEQNRADVFLSAVQSLTVPVVVVHHEAKDGSSGTPAGVQRFRAAYRHTIRIRKCSHESGDGMRLELDVSGNDVPGKTSHEVIVNRRSLSTELAAEPMAPQQAPRGRRAKRMTLEEKATVLGALAREDGQPSVLTHGARASALLGGSRGNEVPAKKLAVAQKLRVKSVSHRTVADIISGYPAEFKAGYMSGGEAA